MDAELRLRPGVVETGLFLDMADYVIVARPDEVTPGLPLDEALAGAPQRDGDFFRVPKIV